MPSQRKKKQKACDIDHDHPLARQEWLASRVLQAMADPRAVCKLALINKNFCAASRSDLVWQTLLPPAAHLDALMPEKWRLLYQSFTKRDLFLLLCKPITLEGGLKKFWLDPLTAGDCYIMSTQALSICSADASESWEWISCQDSWFNKVACLRQVCLFEVCGTFRQLLRPGSYVLSFRMKLLSNLWQRKPVKLCVQNATYSQPPKEAHIFFDNPHSLSYSLYQSPAPPHFKGKQSSRPPLWVECDLGEFTVEDDNAGRPVEVMFSMREVHMPRLKTGFILDGVIVRPRFVINNLCRNRATASSFVSEAWLRSYDDKYSDDEFEDDSENDESIDDFGDDSGNDEGDFGCDSKDDEDDSGDDSEEESQEEYADDQKTNMKV